MEWTAVTVIIAIVGLIATVTTPLIQLNSNITRLTVILDTIKAELEDQKNVERTEGAKVYKIADYVASISAEG